MTIQPDERCFHFNGVSGVTGEYLTPSITEERLARLVRGQRYDSSAYSWLKSIWRRISEPHLGLPLGCNPEALADAGWGIVFHQNERADVRAALASLVQHRAKQIGDDSKTKVLEYRDGDDRSRWLSRNFVGAGSMDPRRVPYYLLLVGGPQRIPFSFCHQLDVEYAVGLLHFADPDEYRSYADSIVKYEADASVRNDREIVYFASRHPFDDATQLSADLLVGPLVNGDGGSASRGVAEEWGFRQRALLGPAATKAALTREFDSRKPAVLFTATHGMGFPRGHPKQETTQGALLCQDWPGGGNMRDEYYFAARDLPKDGSWQGTISFHFGCFTAGTPTEDRFVHQPGQPPPMIADPPFIAQLPRALLAHANGGALACIGHVERAFGYSIVTSDAGPQLGPFRNTLGRILTGQPVGHAMKEFNERYAYLSTSLAHKLEQIGYGNKRITDSELAEDWIERNDAEGYVVIGDPAVRLRTNDLN